MTERYIEKSFPIVGINPLAVKENNWYYPIYQTHKWYARRSACTFRAILLGCAFPPSVDGEPVDLMAEYYRTHQTDPYLARPDGGTLRVLDPFMGGGTTIVEAARLGFEVTGYDYNPVAWFISKGETTEVAPEELDRAFERLDDKVGRYLRRLYTTPCPVTELDADIIYGFWVKQGICISPSCRNKTDLFKSYEIGRKRSGASIDFFADVECPECGSAFDWELDRASITAGGPQVLGENPEGKGRKGRRFAFGLREDGVQCPNCENLIRERDFSRAPELQRKKVPLRVVIDPTSDEFFEVRGGLPDSVESPTTGHTFDPNDGPASTGKFTCSSCGQRQDIVEAARVHGGPLPFKLFGYFAHANEAARKRAREARELGIPTYNYKWFRSARTGDLQKIEACRAELAGRADALPIPDQEIPEGRNFRDLRAHLYCRWSDIFGARHLLGLSILLQAICEEPNEAAREILLGAFQSHLDCTSNLASYHIGHSYVREVTAGHDYRNPTTIAENNIWGVGKNGRGTFSNCVRNARAALEFAQAPYIRDHNGKNTPVDEERIANWNVAVGMGSATSIEEPDASFDLVVTDPPYAGLVQYAEMADFFYVWLHQALKEIYPEFRPQVTLKSEEIIENERDKDADFFFEMLTEAWMEVRRVLTDDGILAFTFHHKEGDRWAGLLRAIFDAGFYLVATYPVHSESLEALSVRATGGITYDIIHVCKKRLGEVQPIAWTQLRKDVRAAAREQLREIESKGDVLPGPDVWMILLGKALKLFSQHYGKVIDHNGEPLDLDEGLERLRVLVREVRGEEIPLPPNLQSADGLSQVYFLHVPGKEGWKRDGLHIELRGYAHSVDDLEDRNLIREGESKGHLEPLPILERFSKHGDSMRGDRRAPLVDKLHLLLGTAHAGNDIKPLMDTWRGDGEWDIIKEGLRYLGKLDPEVKDVGEMVMRTIDALGPEDETQPGQQTSIF